jgi:hypothetical protein
MPAPIKKWDKREPLTAQKLNAPLQFLKSVIRGGRGIKVEIVGDKIVISTTSERIIPK